MKQAVLGHWDLPWLPIAALLIFVVCFGIYTYWTFRSKNRAFYEEASRAPLEEARLSKEFLKGQ